MFSILDTWFYIPKTSTSWQASMTNWNADVYAAKYGMSVSINPAGDQVLFGIQIMNTVTLLGLDRMNQKFGLPLQTLSNGRAIGMGKAVGWLSANLILVLVNTYTLNYVWSSSQIFTYNMTVPNSAVVVSIFPNIQQTLSSTFGPIFLSTVVTKNATVVMLDSHGNYYMLLPSPVGAFSDSSFGTSSSSSLCISGTFHPETNILPCSLCPPGTTTHGLIGQDACVPCANNTFCSLGAAFGNINSSSYLLKYNNQLRAYPVSPQSTRFDNILMQNMFAIHNSSSHRCLLVSPLFWAVIVISFGLLIWLIMFISKRYVKNPLGKRTHECMKRFLKKTDLIGDGELVTGGLFSFSVIVLATFAYSFSNSYLYRYPIDNVTEGAYFACDQTLANAQFSTGLLAAGVPPNDDEAPIFALLDAQSFTLYVDFINAVFNCTDITVTQIKDIYLPMTLLSCNDTGSTVSLSLDLPSHNINLQIQLAGINTIGAIRLSLDGPGMDIKNGTLNAIYTLHNLRFSQPLSMPDRLLTQQPSCAIHLIKVINRTYPLRENTETRFSAVWLPTISRSLDQMFVDAQEYQYATSSSTILSIVINETPYYISNIQRPITDEDELIFTNLLFTIVCLEIFGLGFLIAKLIIIPLAKQTVQFCRRSIQKKKRFTNNVDSPEIEMTKM